MSTSSGEEIDPNPLPASPFYELRSTPSSGRGVFATADIAADTLILSTKTKAAQTTSRITLEEPATDSNPLAWLIQRPYRKEACASCFKYDRGREWHVKHQIRDCGVVFCSKVCLDAWLTLNGDVGVEAWEALEKGIKATLKRRVGGNHHHSRDIVAPGAHGEEGNTVGPDGLNRSGISTGPCDEEIKRAWRDTELIGEVLLNARTKQQPSKTERRVLRNVVDDGGDPDTMYYLLTAVMTAHNAAKTLLLLHNNNNINNHDGSTTLQHHEAAESTTKFSTTAAKTIPPTSTLLAPLFHLNPSATSYSTAHTSLQTYTLSHLCLQHLLPLTLTPFLTTTLTHNLNTRSAHNAFSIRPDGASDGLDSGEFLGWAVYPSASFFNHSCAPNLRKVMVGREWRFFVDRDVRVGDELCITYLGGEERTLGLVERRRRLLLEWGFGCACVRCVAESVRERERERG